MALQAHEVACLRSWDRHPQFLWHYPEDPWECPCLPGVVLMHAGTVLPREEARDLMARNVPVQMVKDIISMHVLHKFGGVWADLDIFCLGLPIPTYKGYMLCQEPPNRPAGLPMSRTWNALTLSILAMPMQAPKANELAHEFKAFWTDHADKVKAGKRAPVDWAASPVHKMWMENTRALSKQICGVPAAKRQKGPGTWEPKSMYRVLSSIYAVPLPMRLRGFSFDTATLLEGVPGPTAHADGCIIPPLWDVATRSVTINLWSRQWKPEVLQSVLAWAEQVRALHIGAYSPLPAAPHVALVQASRHARLEQAIMACQPRLLSILGAPVAYRVLAQAVSMIEAEWLMQLMDSGAHAHASEQSWVVAVLGMSIAWQSSDRASPLAPTTGPCPGPVPCEPPFHGPCPGSEETPPTGRPMTRGSADGKAGESWLRQLPGVQERHIMPMQVAMATQGGRLHADFLPDFLFPMDLLEASGNAHAEDPHQRTISEAHKKGSPSPCPHASNFGKH